MNNDYSIYNLMPKADYSERLKAIKIIMEQETMSDQQKYNLIKGIISQDLPGNPLRLT